MSSRLFQKQVLKTNIYEIIFEFRLYIFFLFSFVFFKLISDTYTKDDLCVFSCVKHAISAFILRYSFRFFCNFLLVNNYIVKINISYFIYYLHLNIDNRVMLFAPRLQIKYYKSLYNIEIMHIIFSQQLLQQDSFFPSLLLFLAVYFHFKDVELYKTIIVMSQFIHKFCFLR